MGRYGWNPRILSKSRISETNQLPDVTARALTSVLDYQGDTSEAIPMRLTLKPIERIDNHPIFPAGTSGFPFIVDDPVVNGGRAGYRANAVVPPPFPVNSEPLYAVIKWGVGESRRNQIVADWPMCGGSIELVASNVVVYGQISASPLFPPPTAVLPSFAAELGPSSTMGLSDEPLTFSQFNDDIGAYPEVSIPEFARSVVVGFNDTLAAGEFITFSFIRQNVSVVFATRVDFATRGPIEIAVPGGATMLALTTNAAAAVGLYLQWRIAP